MAINILKALDHYSTNTRIVCFNFSVALDFLRFVMRVLLSILSFQSPKEQVENMELVENTKWKITLCVDIDVNFLPDPG